MSDHKSAVIYARFSSDKQRDESIDDQLRVCRAFCERQGYEIAGEYSDRAMSGTTDHRPAFLRMIDEADGVDYVVVYKMDRFSRDVYDAAIYKKRLAEKGARVVSATENVPDTPEGIILEKLLEGMAAFYSKQLAQNVRRGMEGNALKGKSNGYRIFGYRTDPETRRYVVDEAEAGIVRDVFRRYIAGETLNSIGTMYGERGVKSRFGNPVGYSWAQNIIHNEAYIGVYEWGGVRNPDGIPPIIDYATFDAAQHSTRRKVRAMENFDVYPLTGKLFCGLCGDPMHGMSARGKSGKKYLYYRCKDAGCRRPIRKEILEEAIQREIIAVIDDEGTARALARHIVEAYGGSDDNAVKACEDAISANKKAQSNILKAIERGIVPEGTEERLEALSREMDALKAEHGRLMAERMELDEDTLTEFFLHGFKADDSIVLGGFLNNVYLFDGYAVATLNFRGETNGLAEVRIALDELKAEKEKNPSGEGFDCNRFGAPNGLLDKIILLRNGIGIIVDLAA